MPRPDEAVEIYESFQNVFLKSSIAAIESFVMFVTQSQEPIH